METPIINWQHVQFACLRTFINTSRYLRNLPWLYPELQPDLVKTYAGRRDLYPSRIFKPRSKTNQKQDGALLPLVIDVHGGGFMLNNPAMDDGLARHLADTAQCVVISIDYGKAPQNKFPKAYEDVVESSLAIIDDADLPIDRKRVVFCGSSAGGNLILGAAQDSRLRHKVFAITALYPLCDLLPSGEEKMATRPDATIPDFLGSTYQMVAGLYLDEQEDLSLTDNRLSPTYFASRDHLPSNVLFVGTEHDMLCHEAEVMIDKLADGASKEEMPSGWRAGGVRWHKINGQLHAFDHFPIKDTEKEKERLAAREATYSLLSDYLIEIFAKNSGDK